MSDPIKIMFKQFGKVRLSYLKTLQGAPIRAFMVEVGNKLWTLQLVMPNFVYISDVTGSKIRAAEKNQHLAKIAGLDFPAHGVE